MPVVNQGWAYVSGTTSAGGSDTQIQYNDGGSLAGSADLTWDGSQVATTNLSASTNISASYFYGDGSNLTGLTASAVNVADGPEYSIQFRRDHPITGEISGSQNLKFVGNSDLNLTGTLHLSSSVDLNAVALRMTGTADIHGNLVVGNGSGGGYISANGDLNTRLRFGISGSDSLSLEAGGQPLFVIDNNGADRIIMGTPSNYVTASISGNLLVCNGTASIAHLSGCSPIQVHAPMSSSHNISASAFYGNGAGITGISLINLDAAGSDTNVQFNQNGEFAANAGFAYDGTGSITVSGALGSTNYMKDWGGGEMATTESLGGKLTLGGYGSPYIQTRETKVPDAGLTFNNFTLGHSGQVLISSSLTQGGLETPGLKFVCNPGAGLAEFEVDNVAFLHNTASLSGDSLEYMWSIQNGGEYDEEDESAFVKLDMSSSTKSFTVGGSSADNIMLTAERGLTVNNVAATINAGLVVNTTDATINSNLVANGNVTLGNAFGDSITWNAGSVIQTAHSGTWKLKDGVDGLSANGALMFFTGSGGDFMKFHTSGSAKGIVFPQETYLSKGASLSGTLAGTGSYLGLDANNKLVLATAGGGGGGGTPAGSDTFVQFNQNGSFGGDSGLVYDGSGSLSASSNISGSSLYLTNDIVLGDDQQIYFEDDLATYIESDTTDRLRFVVGGNQMLLLDEDEDRVNIGFGNKLAVGLGNNTTPDAVLHVSSSGGSSPALQVTTDEDEGSLYVTSDTGRVGIGTTSPSYLLHVSGTNATARAFVASDSAAIDILPSNGPAITFGTPADPDAYMKFGTFAGTNTLWLNHASFDYMISGSAGGIGYYFDQSEQTVGIGTTTPTATLTVAGSGSFSGSGGDGLLTAGRDVYFGNGSERSMGAVNVMTEEGNLDYLMVRNSSGAILLTGSGGVEIEGGGGEEGLLLVGTGLKIAQDNSDDAPTTFETAANTGDVRTSGSVGIGVPGATRLSLDVHYTGTLRPENLSNNTGGGEVIYFGTASANLTAGGIYYLNPQGGWESVNSATTGSGHDQLLGIALGDKPGESGVLIKGYFDVHTFYSGSFVKGGPMYIQSSSVDRGAVEGGYLSGAAPTATDSFVRVVGYGTDTANVIYFNPDSTYVEIG